MSESSRAFHLDAPSSSSSAAAAGDHHHHGKPASATTAGGGGGGGSVPFHRLFAFADGADAALMSLGTLGALANGAAMPLMTVLFARLIDAFGGATDTRDVVARVSNVSLQFLYLAVASAVASFVQVACWMITGERQAARIRGLYLRAILRQEVAFFDQRATTGEVVGRMAGDTVLIQDAMGEKVGKCIQLLVAFAGGFVVAFAQGWLLALVMLATIPPLVLAGALMSSVVARMASLGQAAYADAAVVVDQTIGSITTVASFTGEQRAVAKYSSSLKRAYSSGVWEGLAAGVGMGIVMVLLFCGYSLGIWYGAKLILEKGYTGAQVMNVIFAVLTGSLLVCDMSLGLCCTCVEHRDGSRRRGESQGGRAVLMDLRGEGRTWGLDRGTRRPSD